METFREIKPRHCYEVLHLEQIFLPELINHYGHFFLKYTEVIDSYNDDFNLVQRPPNTPNTCRSIFPQAALNKLDTDPTIPMLVCLAIEKVSSKSIERIKWMLYENPQLGAFEC